MPATRGQARFGRRRNFAETRALDAYFIQILTLRCGLWAGWQALGRVRVNEMEHRHNERPRNLKGDETAIWKTDRWWLMHLRRGAAATFTGTNLHRKRG